MMLQWLGVLIILWVFSTLILCPIMEITAGKHIAWTWFLITTLGMVITVTTFVKGAN